MNTKEIAELLNNREYPLRIPKEISEAAKGNGIVIVYGASDDLMELDGAINDEYGAWNGEEYQIDKNGLLFDYNGEPTKDSEYRSKNCNTLKANWCKCDKYSFTYDLDAPHEKFDVREDGDYYCEGIVFKLADLNG